MKIFDELKANIAELEEYLDTHGEDNTEECIENLKFLINLIEKGYSLNKDINDFKGMEPHEIPHAGDEWLKKAQAAIAEQIKLAKLESRAGVFILPTKDSTVMQGFVELEKAVSNKKYEESRILINELFEDFSYDEIYESIVSFDESKQQ